MKRYFLCIVIIISMTSFNDPDVYFMKALPKLKTVTEWVEYIATTESDAIKRIQSVREYYPNGKLKKFLFIHNDSDTTLVYFQLNKDSTINKALAYFRNHNNKPSVFQTYHYKNDSKYPYTISSRYNTYSYLYNNKGSVLRNTEYIKKGHIPIGQFDYIYDSTGTIIQSLKYFYSNNIIGKPKGEKMIS